jgi:multidrug efflux pump subunit AcrA (membrane-fusion protein)
VFVETMKLTSTAALFVGLALTAWAAARAQTAADAPVNPVIENAKVVLVDDLELSASEMGELTYLGVKEGEPVSEGAEIAKIDDRQAIIAREAARHGLKAAAERAKSDVEVRHARAAAAVAKETYEGMLKANSGKIEGAITKTDLREKELEWKRAVLAIEKSEHDMSLAAMDAWAKKAELDAAELAIEQRTVKAPFNGQVAEVYRQQSEWVNKGDPILRLIRLDTLYVDGALYLDQYNPREIRGCEVTIDVPVGRGEVAQVPGRIVNVSPELRYAGSAGQQTYVVRAEITNRSDDGQWLVLPGHQATMTIKLGTAAPAVTARP